MEWLPNFYRPRTLALSVTAEDRTFNLSFDSLTTAQKKAVYAFISIPGAAMAIVFWKYAPPTVSVSFLLLLVAALLCFLTEKKFVFATSERQCRISYRLCFCRRPFFSRLLNFSAEGRFTFFRENDDECHWIVAFVDSATHRESVLLVVDSSVPAEVIRQFTSDLSVRLGLVEEASGNNLVRGHTDV